MKKFSNYIFILIVSFFAFNIFIKNNAEADAKQSYESYVSGKAIIIDVREEDEVKDGMIKGAKWIPLSKITNNLNQEIANIKKIADNKEIFLYCRSGNRSGKVQAILKEAGIKSVNLGGYSDLVSENIPSMSGPEKI
jgi:phage shock protein E